MKRTLIVLASFVVSAITPAQNFFTGTQAEGPDNVKIIDTNPTTIHSFKFMEANAGGVNVACGRFNSDLIPDFLITGATNGNGHVIVYDGRSRRAIFDFQAFTGFTGGANVAAGDVNGDGTADILVGGEGMNGPVRVFSGTNLAVLHSFNAFPGFAGGVRVAAGDVNGDGADDVIIGPGPGMAPHISVYNGLNGNTLYNFDAFATTFTGGVRVASGDVDGDGKDDIIVGAGPGGGPNVKVFSGANGSVIDNFFAFPSTYTGGVFVAGGDVNGDGKDDIIVGSGNGGNSVKGFSAVALQVLYDWQPEGPSYTGGFSVAASDKPATLDFGFYINKDSVAGQNSVLGSVFTNMLVGADTTFTLSDNSSLITTPANAVIAVSHSFKNFQITTTAINSTINVTVSARLGAVTQTRPFTLAPLIPTAVAFNPSSVTGGGSSQGRVVVNGVAGPGGRTISIVENSPYVTCPTSVVVPPGGTDVFFPITTTAVPSNQMVPIKAIVSAGQASGIFRVNK
jgi:hypothetical protein